MKLSKRITNLNDDKSVEQTIEQVHEIKAT